MSSRLLAYLALTTTSLVWSIGAILIKYSLSYTSPLTFLFWRFLIVSWIFLPLLIGRLGKEKLTIKELVHLSFLGIMSTSLTLGLLFWGMSLTTATESIIINSLSPIFIILGGVFFLKEKISKTEKIGAGLAVLGSLFTIVQPILDAQTKSVNLTGNILVLASVFVWSTYSLMVRKEEKGKKYSPFTLTAISFIAGLITITPFFLAEKIALAQPVFLIAPQAWLSIVYMAILGSCVAYFTYNLGLSLIEASQASLFTYLQPVFSIPLAIIWLKDKIDIWIIIGAILIIIGVFLTEYKPTKTKFRY